jgi:glucan phosphoethanolaminetransferase (alkaline phosphatase superfamily)
MNGTPWARTLVRFRLWIQVAWWVSFVAWVGVVVDNYVVHIPYALGRQCIPCYNYVYYVYNFGYSVGSPGVVGAAFFATSIIFLLLLWAPSQGLLTASLRVLLVVAPAMVFLFEVGVYFFLNYAWDIHATNFLEGTPFTNWVVFVLSGTVLPLGVAVELLRRRTMRAR